MQKQMLHLLNQMALYEIYVFPYYKLFILSIIKKNDNTLYLYKESKRIIYKYKLCSLYIIYDQYFTSNNIELAEINNLLKNLMITSIKTIQNH